MAFNKVPSQSTYSAKDVPLVREINSRGSSNFKDEYYTNVFPEYLKNKVAQDKELNLIKRSGSAQFISPMGTGTLRGVFHWKDPSKLFICVGTDVFVYNSVNGSLLATLPSIVGAGTTDVGFCDYLYEDGTTVVIVTDGTILSQVNSSNVVTASSSPDLPIPHVPAPYFYDGYLLLIKTNTADCYNSDLNDPLAYTPGNFITAEMRADLAIDLVTLNNYFLILGNQSIEYFWDAGNATGSPFQRNDTPIKLSGYIGGKAQFGNKVYIVAEEVEGQPDVFVLEDFKMTPVGNEAIRRHLSSVNLTNVRGNVISIDGNDMYVLDTGTATYFMQIETKLWGLLQYQQTSRFPMFKAFSINTSNGSEGVFTLQNSNAIFKFSPTLYQDSGVDFICTIVTDAFQFDTWNQKFMSGLVPYADRPPGDALLQLQFTDDDYKTWSNSRSVNLNQERADIVRLGRFRKRAFKLTYTANQPLRISKLECQINMGQT